MCALQIFCIISIIILYICDYLCFLRLQIVFSVFKLKMQNNVMKKYTSYVNYLVIYLSLKFQQKHILFISLEQAFESFKLLGQNIP